MGQVGCGGGGGGGGGGRGGDKDQKLSSIIQEVKTAMSR